MTAGGPRIAAVVAARGPSLAVVLVVAGAAALAGAGWIYAHPPTTEVTDRTQEATVATSGTTAAVVTGNTSLYDDGTVLVDRPVYLLSATPRVRVNQTATVPAGRPVAVTQKLRLRYRATRDGEQFWSDTETLVSNTTTTRDGKVVTRGTIDAGAVRKRIRAVKAEVGGSGSVRVSLRVVVTYRAGEHEGRITGTTPLSVTDQWLSVRPPAAERTHARNSTRTVELPNRDPTPYAALGGAGALATVAGLATGLGYLRRYRHVDGAVLEFRVHRARYDEWVSTGRLPATGDRTTVRMATLEDLVDVAIDANRRVVFDPELGVYAVIDGDSVYRFEPPGSDGGTEFTMPVAGDGDPGE